MKTRNPFIRLLTIATLLFACGACDKTDVPTGGDTVQDIDGNVYKTIKIGDQVWLAENLRTTRYKDGTPIPLVTENDTWAALSTGAYSNYNNLESNAATHGRLYNWYAVNSGKLAMEGWRVPDEDDWATLENYLTASGYNYDGTNSRNRFAKSLASKTGWEPSDEPGTPGADQQDNNRTGFSGYPYGRRDRDGLFDLFGSHAYWWSATASSSPANANLRFLSYNGYSLNFLGTVKQSGFSVRLIRNNNNP